MANKRKSLLVLAALIVIPLSLSVRDGDTRLLPLIAGVIGILLFFTFLIRSMEKKGKPQAQELWARTLTFWWMLAAFLVAMETPVFVFFALMGTLCGVALHEFFLLKPTSRASRWLGYLSVGVAIYASYTKNFPLFLLNVPVISIIFLPIVFVLKNRTEGVVGEIGIATLGMLFFSLALGHVLYMIQMGLAVVMFCFFITEIRDLISYWVGKGIAKLARKEIPFFKILDHRIAPLVSPHKAWGAALISTLLCSFLAVAMIPIFPMSLSEVISPMLAAVLGVAIGFFGLMGDLVFSMLKRDVGVKDSGKFFPGESGVIDRVDSLVFTVPVIFHLIYWNLPQAMR